MFITARIWRGAAGLDAKYIKKNLKSDKKKFKNIPLYVDYFLFLFLLFNLCKTRVALISNVSFTSPIM